MALGLKPHIPNPQEAVLNQELRKAVQAAGPKRIAGLLLESALVYHATFGTEFPTVLVNKVGAPPDGLVIGLTGNGDTQTSVPAQNPGPGLIFSATKDITVRQVACHCALSPLPAQLPPAFTAVADFFLPAELALTPASGFPVQWAAIVGIRDRNNFDDPDFKFAGATHQVRFAAGDTEAGLGLGLGGGATTLTSTERVPESDAYPPGSMRSFTLEAYISFWQKKGVSRLRTPGKIWPERAWTFDFAQTTGIAFGLAIADIPATSTTPATATAGTATAIATSFRIFDAGLLSLVALDSLLGLEFSG